MRLNYSLLQFALLNLITALLFSCSTPAQVKAPLSPIADDSWPSVGNTYLKLFQNGRTRHLKDNGVYSLKKVPFAFMFPIKEYDARNQKFHSVRISASTNSKLLNIDTAAKLDNLDEATHFSSGTGLAPSASGRYDVFFLTDFPAHHYIIYHHTVREQQRAIPVKKLPDGHYEVLFDIKKFNIKEQDVSFEKLSATHLYFLIFTDINLNSRIEPGELFRITLELSE